MKSRGFSVVELIISLAILASAGLLVMATLTRMLKPSQKAVDLSAGVVVAESVMQEEVRAILTEQPGALAKLSFLNDNSPPNPPITGNITVGGTDFLYEIGYQTVVDLSTGDPLGGTDLEDRVKKVDITVWWWNTNADDARDGYGQLKTEASQIFLYNPEL